MFCFTSVVTNWSEIQSEHDAYVFSEPDGRIDEDVVGGVDQGGVMFRLLNADKPLHGSQLSLGSLVLAVVTHSKRR